MKTPQDYPIEQLVEYVRSQGYQVIKTGPKIGSLRYQRESHELDKPCWNTFESRRKRNGGQKARTQEEIDTILRRCFAMV